ncbi:Uncharacterised protein [Mycobacteroides abscessus subsp. abscessus]|nr:Uncharacterised protein [Mycobacteroides abscessus subsp. abscessus]
MPPWAPAIPQARTGDVTTMATVKPTASESAGFPCNATRFPTTMYPAQNSAASSAKAIPAGSAAS